LYKDFQLGGRIYTGKYGHQNIRRIERSTITFETWPGKIWLSVEWDYGCLHGLLGYHEKGLDFHGDLYELSGVDPLARPLIKLVMNTAINALNRHECIGSCFEEMSRVKGKDEQGKPKWKTGKELETHEELVAASKKCGLKFKNRYELFSQIYDLLLVKHAAIADLFGSDSGRRFQRIDSAIALDILADFADRGVPILGVHDSFVVPELWGEDLKRLMLQVYKQHVGFWPRLKKVV
jgi:hypothetical protein